MLPLISSCAKHLSLWMVALIYFTQSIYNIGDLSVQSEQIVIAGFTSNITVTGCLTIIGETTLLLQLLEEDTVTVCITFKRI